MAADWKIQPATLGDLADQGMDVWAWRNGCFKNGAVATDALIARLSGDYPPSSVKDRAKDRVRAADCFGD